MYEYKVNEDKARLGDRIGPFIVRISGKGRALHAAYLDGPYVNEGFRESYAHFAILEYDINENIPKLYVVHNNEDGKYEHTVLSKNVITGEYSERTIKQGIPNYYPTGQIYCDSTDGTNKLFKEYRKDKFKNDDFVRAIGGNIDNCPVSE